MALRSDNRGEIVERIVWAGKMALLVGITGSVVAVVTYCRHGPNPSAHRQTQQHEARPSRNRGGRASCVE